VAQQQCQHADDKDSRRVAEAPPHSRQPGAAFSLDGIGRDRRQVVGPRKNVNEAGDEAGKHECHDASGLSSRCNMQEPDARASR
jgi:hypothetical protein